MNKKINWYDLKFFRKIIDHFLFYGLKIIICFDARKRELADLSPEKINKILFIATAGIGDTLFATPAIRGLRENFPLAQIDLLLNETYADFFRHNPHINKVLTVPSNGYRNFLHSIKLLRRECYDVAIVSHAHDYAGTVRPYLAGIRFIIGGMWYRTRFWFLLSNREEHLVYQRDKHSLIGHQLNLIKLLDCAPKDQRMEVNLSAEDWNSAKLIWQRLGIVAGNITIAFQLKTQAPSKDWPVENFAGLGKALLAWHLGLKIILLGGKQDRETADWVEREIANNRLSNLVGETSLQESAAVLSKIELLITGVTGMLHIATALDKNTIALFGGFEDPERLGTINADNQKRITAIKGHKMCEPCNMRVCRPPAKCLESISVEEVLKIVQETIDKCSIS